MRGKRQPYYSRDSCIVRIHLGGYCQLAEKRNLWQTDGMKTNITAPNDKGFRFPPEIMSHAVWLNFRFSLSF